MDLMRGLMSSRICQYAQTLWTQIPNRTHCEVWRGDFPLVLACSCQAIFPSCQLISHFAPLYF